MLGAPGSSVVELREVAMIRVSTVHARDNLSELINRAAYGKERVVLTRRGKSLAALVPLEDLEFLEQLESRIDYEDARLALAETKGEGSVAWEDLKAELGL
jgi:prevent-host-death family protein